MLVKDHRPSALKAAFLHRAQEAAPEHLVFGVADVDGEWLVETAAQRAPRAGVAAEGDDVSRLR